MKHVMLALMMSLGLAVPAGAQPSFAANYATAEFNLDIGANQRLDDALQQLADQTGLFLAYDERQTFGVFVNDVAGRMTVDEALRRMLAGTGLSYSLDEFSGRAVILPRDVLLQRLSPFFDNGSSTFNGASSHARPPP